MLAPSPAKKSTTQSKNVKKEGNTSPSPNIGQESSSAGTSGDIDHGPPPDLSTAIQQDHHPVSLLTKVLKQSPLSSGFTTPVNFKKSECGSRASQLSPCRLAELGLGPMNYAGGWTDEEEEARGMPANGGEGMMEVDGPAGEEKPPNREGEGEPIVEDMKERQKMRPLGRHTLRKSIEPIGPPGTGSIRIPMEKPKATISYHAARQFLAEDLVEEVHERRHITLGWQHAGHVASAITRLMGVAIGQFRPQVDGVPIAIGDVRVIKPLYIMDDHNCMNVDVDIQMIIFKVQPGEDAPGRGQREILCRADRLLGKECVIGTAFGNLGMNCRPIPPGVEVGTVFKARFTGVNFRNGMCTVQCAPLAYKRFES